MRDRKGWTQTQLARRAGVAQTVIADLMRKYGITNNEAEAVDMVTRHDSRRRS